MGKKSAHVRRGATKGSKSYGLYMNQQVGRIMEIVRPKVKPEAVEKVKSAYDKLPEEGEEWAAQTPTDE